MIPTRKDVEARLTEVFREVFFDPALTLTDGMTAADVPGWDSIRNVELVVTIEGAFGIRFPLHEVAKLECVGQLIDAVTAHVAAKGPSSGG